ncbi:hypothetical protein [Rhodococcus koreensis]|uniref:hypothetical protein n=1 Tax=Rhodococcus koreensis TaxID=99653 RepID=UPI000AE058FC|nr:hypothetical protein [Rhodococcus koreensis]
MFVSLITGHCSGTGGDVDSHPTALTALRAAAVIVSRVGLSLRGVVPRYPREWIFGAALGV